MAGHSSPESSNGGDAGGFDNQNPSTTRTSSFSPLPGRDASGQQASIGGLKTIQRDLASVESFHNAWLKHQERLKANSKQSFMASTTVNRLIDNYHIMISNHLRGGFRNAGPSSADSRRFARISIANTIEKYDRLLEERRKLLEDQGVLLEIASEVAHLKSTEKLLAALELQIAVAQDLNEQMTARAAMTGWKVFKQSTCG